MKYQRQLHIQRFIHSGLPCTNCSEKGYWVVATLNCYHLRGRGKPCTENPKSLQNLFILAVHRTLVILVAPADRKTTACLWKGVMRKVQKLGVVGLSRHFDPKTDTKPRKSLGFFHVRIREQNFSTQKPPLPGGVPPKKKYCRTETPTTLILYLRVEYWCVSWCGVGALLELV